jgi:pSer/pThr/pTyr-binding forkhead associated (FHA) protein
MSSTMKVNKFDILFEKIPKDPELWNEEDVRLWLNIIGMEQYADHFSDMKIDGLLILELSEEELTEELKIATKLHRKKILKAIEVLKEYQNYFRDKSEHGGNKMKNFVVEEAVLGTPNEPINTDQLTKAQEGSSLRRGQVGEEGIRNLIPVNSQLKSSKFDRKNDQQLLQLNSDIQPNTQLPKLTSIPLFNESQVGSQNLPYNPVHDNLIEDSEIFFDPGLENDNPVEAVPETNQISQEEAYIVILSIEGPSDLNHTITEQGSRIGRHSSNQIVIYDESISRHHAEIFYNEEEKKFYLRDVGSTTGTFLKIADPIEMQLDMIIEIGSYQLMVSNIFIHKSANFEENTINSFVELTVYESPDEVHERVFALTSGSSVGRKENNALSFSEDLHMSNLHCKINLIGQKFFFEDMASNNGSRLRLSKEGIKSASIPLLRETVFKIGNSAMYEVNVPRTGKANNGLSTINHNLEKSSSHNAMLCTICWDAERDCLIMPCKHNITCTRCVKSVKNCPVCRAVISDIIKIYKA